MKSLNLKGRLVTLEQPLVVGILNVTPDSFFAGSRKQTEQDIRERISTILEEGGDLIDVGAYSSRPQASPVSADEEKQRLLLALQILKTDFPEALVSVDTFRSEIAQWGVSEFGVALINDISGGSLDSNMFKTISELQVPYILMHMRGTPQTMQQFTSYTDLMEDVMLYFAEKLRMLETWGVHDVIVDPGFGFSKNLDQNYELMRCLSEFLTLGRPLLVGVSRKSMIYNLLNGTPAESLNGTTVLHTYALLNGANLLRVHDVKSAKEAVKIVNKLKK